MLVVIDLIIHNISAYRHLLYNMKIQPFVIVKLQGVSKNKVWWQEHHVSHVRLAVIFLFCDAYDKWISGRSGVYNIYDLEWM
ncbi:hypothetical protein TELCIR_20094 [Teladorsagia circumcincta]|uniref:Protein ARV n=1 Tax=Teladorsagia circumcincta TaxID=45464 RepID=A0A2G9TKH5_TELCI|nr:hypothetical protein TELCIR_20094 [Teladorsagia circumcincta]